MNDTSAHSKVVLGVDDSPEDRGKSRDDVNWGIEVGGNDFIIKPFERGKLLARVHHWTNRRI